MSYLVSTPTTAVVAPSIIKQCLVLCGINVKLVDGSLHMCVVMQAAPMFQLSRGSMFIV